MNLHLLTYELIDLTRISHYALNILKPVESRIIYVDVLEGLRLDVGVQAAGGVGSSFIMLTELTQASCNPCLLNLILVDIIGIAIGQRWAYRTICPEQSHLLAFLITLS